MLGALFIAPGSLLESATLGVVVACVLAVVVGLFAIPAEPRGARRERGPLAAVVRAPARTRGCGCPSACRASRWSRCCSRRSRCCCSRRRRWRSTPDRPTSRTCRPTTRRARASRPSSATAAPGGRRRSRSTSRRRGRSRPRRGCGRLKRFQQQVARQPGIEAVLGPASLLERTEVLRSLTRQIASGGRQLNRLEGGLERLLFATGPAESRPGAGGGRRRPRSTTGLARRRPARTRSRRAPRNAVPQTQRLAAGVARTTEREPSSSRRPRGRASKGARELQDAIDELARIIDRENDQAEAKLIDPVNTAQSAVQSALRNLGSVGPGGGGRPRRAARACRRAARAGGARPAEVEHRQLRDRVRGQLRGGEADHARHGPARRGPRADRERHAAISTPASPRRRPARRSSPARPVN